jgi:hypothetical protein
VIFSKGVGGFLPGVKQIANVASLPGIVGVNHEFYTFRNTGLHIFIYVLQTNLNYTVEICWIA